MLDIKFIRENIDLVKENCKNRLSNADVDSFIELDKRHRKMEAEMNELRAKRNVASKTKPSVEQMEEMRIMGDKIKKIEDELALSDKKIREIWFSIPNMTHPDVVVSIDESDNPVVETFLKPTIFDFDSRDHMQLGKINDLIDFDRATKVSGAKFYYLKNELALMEFALIQYALETVIKHNFIPFSTPDLARRDVLEGLGFNPRGESTQIYNIEDTNLSLVGTAEITMGGYHMDEVLDESELPKKYVAVSHCFRTEAGSYSKFSKGIFRVHQFTKIEMFQYVMPERSEETQKELLAIEKEIFEGLKIPFRVVDHCTADLGAPSIRTYDLEAWMPGKPNEGGGMGDWAEITSTSNCTDYQARGLNIKYKALDGTKGYVHMLNGTAIAVSRAIIAIVENYQQEDGSIIIPDVLKRFMPGNIEIIKRK
jgi:seryl-tRNA synthetase